MNELVKHLLSIGNHYGAGNREAIDFWVAAGTLFTALATLALAALTLFSLALTRRLIAGERKRHEQQYAPILFIENIVSDGWRGWSVRNHGLGPALNIGFEFDGFSIPEALDYRRIDGTIYERIVVPGQSWHLCFSDYPEVFGGLDVFDPDKTHGDAVIRYSDLFGNSYYTAISTIAREGWYRARWVPNQNLFGKQDNFELVWKFTVRQSNKWWTNRREERRKSAERIQNLNRQVKAAHDSLRTTRDSGKDSKRKD
jgi:hypothetical protein